MIEIEHVSKYYGDFPAVTDISFSVGKGEILGFLGPNGAGKSTTMKMLTGFLPPSSGTVRIAGSDIVSDSLEARRHIGYLPETVPLYTDMEVTDYLKFMGRIRGMSSNYVARRINEVIDIVNLGVYRNTHIGKLSKGFRQRVGIAQAILHEPDVLVLDEPTIGIDPIQVVETRQLIKSLGGEHTLVISTHILPEVSMICERVIIINEGQIVAEDTPEMLATRLRGVDRIELDVKGPSKEIADAISAVEGVTDVDHHYVQNGGHTTYAVSLLPDLELRSRLASAVVTGGWELLRLQSVGMTLEEIFLQVTTEEQIPGVIGAVEEEAQQG
ncbi:MAG: MFS transporter [SAR202 cluster bacterium Casp-Chloro-G4]|nr:ATP-binding cassette domain-containing protein [Chloroflexota bacterium]MDA1227763.1 ATP-binding cassette domain-containing protein [Chloroflexota bacterium]PKB61564.1 MAG: MFS transporter [SAR202 cluster bacterium Casp-Chloro-G4]